MNQSINQRNFYSAIQNMDCGARQRKYIQRGPKKRGQRVSYANILKTPRPNCVEILRVFACLFTHYRLV